MTDKVKLVWATEKAEDLLAYMAKVSNPAMQSEGSYTKLISYLIRNQHWSPFEMVHMCIEINTTRDIARQILRHRSFSFQEFSQRYADVSLLGNMETRECRLQDTKNRQSSFPTEDRELADWWEKAQKEHSEKALAVYKEALAKGIAKEQARVVMPEGNTASRMYMVGSLRSWIHYVGLRKGNGTQKEHQEIALGAAELVASSFPATYTAINHKEVSL